ncbi:PorV/PorQ family protein [candidate division KSB1 bacterium]|nr:PorV/PorQ family protein [candidate division KSB1 bacterium]
MRKQTLTYILSWSKWTIVPRVKWLVLFLLIINIAIAGAQVRSGAAFLKMLPGARLQSMGAAYTGVIDEIHAMYANPAAGGLFREWQWSASYTRWFADIYNASFLYGRKIHTPWSRHTHLNIGLQYQGMPDFDSSEHLAPAVSANDWVVAANLGQPITMVTEHLSAGANAKYYRSTLAEYHAHAWIYDLGLLYRTPRFTLQSDGPFRYGIVSAGLSLINMGKEIKFISVGTPLPQALRAGLAFNTGSHNGWHLHLAADYQKGRDEGDNFGLGAEVTWRQRLAIQGGYDNNMDLMSRYTFGMSFILDDQATPMNSVIPGQNDALRLDVASIEELDFFSNTYRGTVSHYPIGPEKFTFLQPEMGAWIYSDTVTLSYQASRDPDLFDDLKYAVIVGCDSFKLAELIVKIDTELPNLKEHADDFLVARNEFDAEQMQLSKLRGGDYYWSVVAYDSDWHMRLAAKKGMTISHFHIPLTDVSVDSIWFEYSPWLTVDDYHGMLHVRVANNGERNFDHVTLSVMDSLEHTHSRYPSQPIGTRRYLQRISIDAFQAGEKRTLDIPWRTVDLGRHGISALIDDEAMIHEDDENNNLYKDVFYTIPKGSIAAKDTVTAVNFARRSFDLPIITEICFDTLSARVKSEYLVTKVIEPLIETMSSRLRENPDLKISLQGFADTNSGETDVSLANQRSRAVRDSMLTRGVRPDQIAIIEGEVLPRRYIPSNPQDALWVFQERRYVKISADDISQNVLFQPITFVDIEHMALPVTFLSIIRGYLPITGAALLIANPIIRDTLDVQHRVVRSDIKGDINWEIDRNPFLDISEWIDRKANYEINLTDSLDRRFKSRPRAVFLNAKSFLQEHTVAFPLQFDRTDPLYNFYWANIFQFVKMVVNEPHRRFRFFGHACAIGAEWYNLRLSGQRAQAFHDGFLRYTIQNYPELYETISSQTEPAKGFGETRPIGVMRSSGEFILIGDNNMPMGRKYNRRIEINFYSTENLLRK